VIRWVSKSTVVALTSTSQEVTTNLATIGDKIQNNNKSSVRNIYCNNIFNYILGYQHDIEN